MTTITTYAELKQNIEDYTKRSGSDMGGKLDQFIDAAESDINKDLRVREMESQATATTSTSDRYVSLPTGFIKMRRMMITIDGVLYQVPQLPHGSVMAIYDDGAVPTQFSVTSQIEMNRKSDQAYTLTIDYYQEVTALSGSNTSTTVLTTYPMIYLAGCLKHAFRWNMQYDLADYWDGKFKEEVAKANRKARAGRIGPTPVVLPHGGMVV